MRKWLNRIGIGLLAIAGLSMIAADAFAQASSSPFGQTSHQFFLQFDMLAPTDINCDAAGPGVQTWVTRSISGKPILRISGDVRAAEITCWRSDGSRYTTNAHRELFFSTGAPIRGTVTYNRNRDAMTVVLRRGDEERVAKVVHRSFVRVK